MRMYIRNGGTKFTYAIPLPFGAICALLTPYAPSIHPPTAVATAVATAVDTAVNTDVATAVATAVARVSEAVLRHPSIPAMYFASPYMYFAYLV